MIDRVQRNSSNHAQQRSSHRTLHSRELATYCRSIANYLRCVGRGTERPRQLIGLTSSNRGAGVSTFCAHLAVTLADSSFDGEKGILVDANHQNPSLHKLFNTPPGPGLADFLDGRANLFDCIHPCDVKNLSILPAGATPDGAIPSCDRTLVTDLISALRSDFSFAVFDLPAATELTSCFVFASHLDAILLVIEAEKTRGEAVQRSLDQLRDAGAFLLGTVLNKHRSYFPKWLYQSL